MLFTFKNFAIRCFEIEGQIWFSGNDVAKALGYAKPNNAINDHTFASDRKSLGYKASLESGLAEITSLWEANDFMNKILINESGLYCMIFGSQLESAEEFKLWVTGTVLPSIRKHGGYVMDQELLTDAQQEKLMKKVEKLSDEVKDLKAKNAKIRADIRKARKEKKALNELCAIWEDMNSKLQAENDKFRRALKPVPAQKFVEYADETFRVDPNGFIVRC